MEMELDVRFARYWNEVGCQSDPVPAYGRLRARYEEPHRFHHTWEHIVSCWDEMDDVLRLLEFPAVIGIGLAYHDAVCNPKTAFNEGRSANVCLGELARADVAVGTRKLVADFVLATNHEHTGDLSSDFLYGLDCDLAIMGKPWSVYAAYKDAVEKEYRHNALTSEVDYVAGRRKFILRKLDEPRRSRVFNTDYFRDRYEVQAITNMETEELVLGERLRRLS